MKNRSGPLVKDDKLYIEQNYTKVHFEEIARTLMRNPETIRKYIEKTFGAANQLSADFEEETKDNALKKSLVWKELKMQFSKDELDKFMYHWRRIVNQFGSDILATEEMQAIDYIRLELLMDRILTEQQKNMNQIAELEKNILEEKANGNDFTKIDSWTNQIAFARGAQEAIGKEYKDMFSNKSKLLGQMKATREARIKHLENSKENIPDWIKRLMMDNTKRQEVGMYMEKMRLAMKKEEERLSKYHTYGDGMVQMPILTVDTIKDKETE